MNDRNQERVSWFWLLVVNLCWWQITLPVYVQNTGMGISCHIANIKSSVQYFSMHCAQVCGCPESVIIDSTTIIWFVSPLSFILLCMWFWFFFFFFLFPMNFSLTKALWKCFMPYVCYVTCLITFYKPINCLVCVFFFFFLEGGGGNFGCQTYNSKLNPSK